MARKKTTSQASAYHFLVLSGINKAEEEVQAAYAEAFQKGYSVVEIARIAGVKAGSYIHATLVQQGLIQAGKAGRRKAGTTPAVMEKYLAARGLSWAKWCAGWGLAEDEAFKQVQAGSGAAIEAIKRDFPGCAKRLKLPAGDLVVPSFDQPRFACNIRWHQEYRCFSSLLVVGETPVSGTIAYGPTVGAAVRNLQLLWRTRLTVARIQQVLNPAKSNDKETRLKAVW